MTTASSVVRIFVALCLVCSVAGAAPGQLPGPIGKCLGTPGEWEGCRGSNGCAVCDELVDGYPLYYDNHPLCSPNYLCGGLYFTCNENCPEPTHADLCDTFPGDVNLSSTITIGDISLLISFLTCITEELTSEQIANSDVNGDCEVDMADVDYLVDYLFIDGPAPVPCVCAEPAVSSCRCTETGDVNLNGSITIGDISVLIEFLLLDCELELLELTPDQLIQSDVNGDCAVDVPDVYYLQAYLFENGPDPLPCMCAEKETCRCTETGDVNLNGSITIGDISLLVDFLLDCQLELTSEQLIQADVNGDCAVDKRDVDYLQPYLFEYGPEPVPCMCVEKETCRCTETGDVNLNGSITISDISVLVDFLLDCEPELTPEQLIQSDVNGDCEVNLDDAVYLQAYLFEDGPAPVDCLCVNKVPDCG
ncbi:MAG: hypothetical protein GY856_41195 [bacterium]|nr:hypothetical protein [bacterium]